MRGPVRPLFQTLFQVARDFGALIGSAMRSRAQLAAENLFLRKQLALYLERQVKPRRADDATRITLVGLSWLVDWRPLLTVVKPETLIRWHRKGFRLWWRWKSLRRGRPPIPVDLRQLPPWRPRIGPGGRKTDCRRTSGQARHPSFSAEGATVYAIAATAPETGNTGMEHVRAETRPRRARH